MTSSGNRTHDLPACKTMPQPTAQPRAPRFVFRFQLNKKWTAGIQNKISIGIVRSRTKATGFRGS